MEELSIEQKAKRYDEAIKRLEDIMTGKCQKTFMFTKGLFDYIFPELKENKESDDEKIINNIKKVIGWYRGMFTEKSLMPEEYQEIDAWLEKKGEQETLCDKCKKAQPSHSCQDITELGRCAVEHEQKSTDKVEPKFKVGDFIQFNGMGHTRYTVKEVCGLSHYINTCNKRMDMSYTDANFELVEEPASEEQVKEPTKTQHVKETCKENDDSLTREPVSEIDFEQELYKYFGQVKDFTLGMRIAKRFYEIGRNYQEPVSEDLNTVAKEYANNITEKIGYRLQLRRAVCFGAKWKKERLMAKAVDATVHSDAGGYPYIPQMELYDYEKDIPLAKEGDKYKVILIKEDLL